MVLKAGWILSALMGTGALLMVPSVVLAQGSPVPGQNNSYVSPSGSASYSSSTSSSGYPQAPVPGAASNPYIQGADSGAGSYGGTGKPQGSGKGAYSKLPLNAADAKVRIAELRNLLAVSRPQDVQESVFQLCEWLSDMADAHWKLSLALAKNDAMKAAAAQERQSAVKFSSLKHEAALLKAELFIKQNRLPEALGPLVDIVVAEPKSLIGQAAYEKLKEIGFAERGSEAGYQPEKASEKSVSTAPDLKFAGQELRPVGQVMKTVSGQFKPVSAPLKSVAPLKTVSTQMKTVPADPAYSKTARTAQSPKLP
jgi:hypothetical protein